MMLFLIEDVEVLVESDAWFEGISGTVPNSCRKALLLLHHFSKFHRREVKLCVAEGRSCNGPVEALDEIFALGGVKGHGYEVPVVVHQHVNRERVYRHSFEGSFNVEAVKVARDMDAIEATASRRVKPLMPKV